MTEPNPVGADIAEASYVVGSWRLVITPQGAALLPGDVPVATLRAVRDALGRTIDGDGPGPVLGVLTMASGGAFAQLGPFGVVVLREGGVDLALRGAVSVQVGERELHGRQVSSWREESIDDVTAISLRAEDAGAAGEELPIRDGIVPAAWVRMRGSEVDEPLVPVAGCAHLASLVAGASGPAVTNPAQSPPADAAPASSGPETPELAQPAEPPQPTTAEPTTADPEPEGSARVPTLGATLIPGMLAGEVEATGYQPAASPASAPLDGSGQDYSGLWGDTQLHSVESAAVREAAGEAEAERVAAGGQGTAEGPAAASAPPPQPPQPVAPPTPPPPPVPPVRPDGVELTLSGVPGTGHGSGTQAPPSSPGPSSEAATARQGDHDNLTVTSAELQQARAGAGAGAGAGDVPIDGPSALSLVCERQHPNPPRADTCRTCGLALPGPALRIPRPSLGRLRLPSGETVELTRPVVLGRKPQASRVSANDAPVLQRLDGQEISRSHVEIQLEEWNVLAVDLDSRNGTVLLREGEPARRLNPKDATLLRSGDILDLGEGVMLRLEDVP